MRRWSASSARRCCRSASMCGADVQLSSVQGSAEPVLTHAKPAVHLAVHHDDRDVLRPLLHQRFVAGDVQRLPADADIGSDTGNLVTGVLAQVTAGLRINDHPRHADSRSLPLATLPVVECGSSSTNSTEVGHLKRASLRALHSMTSSALSCAPSCVTTRALTVSPVYGCGTPSTAASAMSGCATRTSS